MADIRRIPFTEMTERVQRELVRDNSAAEGTYKGRVNDVYLYDLPSQIDWRHIRKVGSITTTADYTTGTVALTNGATTCVGTDTVWTSANSNNTLFKAGNYNEVYRVTWTDATNLVLGRNWVEATDTSETYILYQDRYALASDFDHMILDPNQAVYYWSMGAKVYLKYKSLEAFEADQTSTVGDPGYYTLKWISGDPYLFVDPPATDARTIYYAYIPSLVRMTEYTTGTITTLANGGTAVTGSSTDFDGYVTTAGLLLYNYYFRIDSDGTGSSSVWYKVSTAGSDTSLTLTDAYGGTSISSGTSAYTISVISLLPSGLDLAMIYGAAVTSAVDQDSQTQVKGWIGLYQKILEQFRSIEGKKKYGKQRIHTIYERSGVRR